MDKFYIKILFLVLLSLSVWSMSLSAHPFFRRYFLVADTIKVPSYDFFKIKKNVAIDVEFNKPIKPFRVQDLYPSYARNINKDSLNIWASISSVKDKPTISSKRKRKAFHKNKEDAPTVVSKSPNIEEPLELISNLKVYPNPVQFQLSIAFELSQIQNMTFKITDLLGNEVLTLWSGMVDEGKFLKTFSINGKVHPGTYFVRVMSAKSTKVFRIIVQ